jgi:hypothetical protein
MGLGRYLRSAWAALPGWARWVLAVYLIGFADGTAAHARTWPGPGSTLTQDSRRFRCGCSYTAGNWSSIRHDPAWPFTPAGLLLILVFGAFVLATAPVMLRAARIVRDSAPDSGADPAR